jgi:hypothetical protein
VDEEQDFVVSNNESVDDMVKLLASEFTGAPH